MIRGSKKNGEVHFQFCDPLFSELFAPFWMNLIWLKPRFHALQSLTIPGSSFFHLKKRDENYMFFHFGTFFSFVHCRPWMQDPSPKFHRYVEKSLFYKISEPYISIRSNSHKLDCQICIRGWDHWQNSQEIPTFAKKLSFSMAMLKNSMFSA